MYNQQQDPGEIGSLKNFARYVTEHDTTTFTALLFARYKEVHRLDDQGLSNLLGCTEEDLVHLAFCGRPRRDCFEQDVSRIAEHVHAREEALASLYQETMARVPLVGHVYMGWYDNGEWHVTVEGERLESIGYHCPDGFAWGYDGSAPSELALCLLRHHLQEWYVTREFLLQPERAWPRYPECYRWHLAFRDEFLATLEKHARWEMTDQDLNAWLAQKVTV
jgi:hypothetical protein